MTSRSQPSWPHRVRAREEAPNVIMVLVDDMGFSDVSPFGGEIDTPHIQRLADEGYRLTNFHTSPVCSPARAALLTGMNPHRVGFGATTGGDPGYPGHSKEIPENVPTIADSFRASGYATFMVGKWHLTRSAEQHDGADRAAWPLQRGFDRYFGSMDAFTTLFHPHRLVEDNSTFSVDEYPQDYYLSDELTDRAIAMIGDLRANDPRKPFFLYFAHNAVHGPLQAKPGDIDKYRTLYDAGWDHIRDERFRRQIRAGLFPEGTEPAPRNMEQGHEVSAWSELSPEQRRLFARYMEVYAASVDNVDQNLGRLMEELERRGELENTIIAVASDNGGSGEGGPIGTRSYLSHFVGLSALPADWDRDVERDRELIGGPRVFAHYPRGWAYASNTPFRLYKRSTHGGGVRVPLVLSWPRGLTRDDGDRGIRPQFAYMTDLGQTLLDMAGVPPLRERYGRPAPGLDGASFASLFGEAEERGECRHSQALEFAGNRAYFHGRWKIVTNHARGADFTDEEWELYDLEEDPTELHDRAAEQPELVRELADHWHDEAWRNQIFPLDDIGAFARTRPSTELWMSEPITLRPGAATLERFRASRLTGLRSFHVEVVLERVRGDEGVLFSHGDQGGGYVAFIEGEEFHLSYNEYGRMRRASVQLPPHEGPLDLRVIFDTRTGLRWFVTALFDGQSALELGSVRQMVGMAPFTGISVGVDRGSPVDWELFSRRGAFSYSGRLEAVTYTPGPVAGENPELVVEVEQVAARHYD